MLARHTLVIAVLLLGATGAAAQPSSAAQTFESQKAVEAWRQRLLKADETLRQGEWRKGKKLATAVVDDMVARIGSGADDFLAVGVALKAVAEAGLGEEEDALWDWQVAQGLSPAASRVPLGAYGAAGQFLAESSRRAAESDKEIRRIDPPEPLPGTVTKPVIVKQVRPQYPPGASHFRQEAKVVVETILDEEGRILRPRLLDSGGAAVLSYTALQALRQWRFEPATLDGTPVKVFYTLTVNFCVKDCDEPPAEAPGPGGG